MKARPPKGRSSLNIQASLWAGRPCGWGIPRVGHPYGLAGHVGGASQGRSIPVGRSSLGMGHPYRLAGHVGRASLRVGHPKGRSSLCTRHP